MIKTRINNEYKDIIKIFGGGTLQKEITRIWSGEANTYVYESEVEYTGTLPITITADGSALLDYKIYGNTVQDGTPTPEAPVMPEGVGEMTENLFNLSSYFKVSANISDIIINENSITYNAQTPYISIIYKFNLGIADVYTISLGGDSFNTRLELRYIKNDSAVGNIIIIQPNQKTTVRGSDKYDEFRIYISNGNNTGTCIASNIMLNLGSTPLPYEPYGYKLPMTVSDGNTVQTVPVYLGEVETTRRIKKLVLTGEEKWYGSAKYRMDFYGQIGTVRPFCTHYIGVTYTGYSQMQNGQISVNGETAKTLCICDTTNQTSIADWKSYLATQYAAGTPVTVWYVLAVPKTGIVNEPLMKIGDYADTIDSTQATVQIPTFAGTTVIDYDGTTKPSQMYIKYRR